MTADLESLCAMALATSPLYVPSSLANLAGESLRALDYRLDRKHREIAKENLIGNRRAGSFDPYRPWPHRC